MVNQDFCPESFLCRIFWLCANVTAHWKKYFNEQILSYGRLMACAHCSLYASSAVCHGNGDFSWLISFLFRQHCLLHTTPRIVCGFPSSGIMTWCPHHSYAVEASLAWVTFCLCVTPICHMACHGPVYAWYCSLRAPSGGSGNANAYCKYCLYFWCFWSLPYEYFMNSWCAFYNKTSWDWQQGLVSNPELGIHNFSQRLSFVGPYLGEMQELLISQFTSCQ